MGTEGVPFYGPEGEPRAASHLYSPTDMIWGPDSAPYVADWNNHRIRTVHGDDSVWTLAGSGMIGDGFYDPETETWNDDGPAIGYNMNRPTHLAFDPADAGFLYIAAWGNSRILRYKFATEQVEYVAGTGRYDYGGDGGPAADAAFYRTPSSAFDGLGNQYVTDQGNNLIRRIDASGIITAAAGILHGEGYNGDGLPPLETMFSGSGSSNAAPSNSLAWYEAALYIADTESDLVRRFDPATAEISTVAGYFEPDPVLRDENGDSVGDQVLGLGGYSGDGGPAVEAKLDNPRDLAFAEDGTMYIADTDNHCIRVVTPDGVIDTFAGVCGEQGLADPAGPSLAEALPAREALLSRPFGVALDPDGNVYIADTDNHVIRVVWH
jgi:sugar lactone lactonase YvrE